MIYKIGKNHCYYGNKERISVDKFYLYEYMHVGYFLICGFFGLLTICSVSIGVRENLGADLIMTAITLPVLLCLVLCLVLMGLIALVEYLSNSYREIYHHSGDGDVAEAISEKTIFSPTIRWLISKVRISEWMLRKAEEKGDDETAEVARESIRKLDERILEVIYKSKNLEEIWPAISGKASGLRSTTKHGISSSVYSMTKGFFVKIFFK